MRLSPDSRSLVGWDRRGTENFLFFSVRIKEVIKEYKTKDKTKNRTICFPRNPFSRWGKVFKEIFVNHRVSPRTTISQLWIIQAKSQMGHKKSLYLRNNQTQHIKIIDLRQIGILEQGPRFCEFLSTPYRIQWQQVHPQLLDFCSR